MIVNVELTEHGVAKFNQFFAQHAKEGLDMQATLFELMDVIQVRLCLKEDLVYELAGQYTANARPATLTLSAQDINVTHEPEV